MDLREKLAFSEESARFAMARLSCGNQFPRIYEMVILSTCNRTEIYTACGQDDVEEIELFLAEATGLAYASFHKNLYRFSDEAAVEHLFKVASGLDSLVLGEPQILGQVTRSLELAQGCGTCGAVLSNLFRAAISSGKRARTETDISRNPASISSLAATLATQGLENIPAVQVLVIGAGEMAELAVEALRKRGVQHITVINRTMQKAQELAARWQARATTFEHLSEEFQVADIAISSTSAPHTIITATYMEEIMRSRLHRPIVMVDIALPRDIDPGAGRISGVSLFDLDTLSQQVEQLLATRAAEIPQVKQILAEEQAKFEQYLKTLDMLPIIAGLRKQAETIRCQELEKTLQHLPGLTERERKRIDALTRALVKKLLASPTQRLRSEANCPHAPEYATVARTLFALPGEAELCTFSKGQCPVEAAQRYSREQERL